MLVQSPRGKLDCQYAICWDGPDQEVVETDGNIRTGLVLCGGEDDTDNSNFPIEMSQTILTSR